MDVICPFLYLDCRQYAVTPCRKIETYAFLCGLDVRDVLVSQVFDTVGDPTDSIFNAPWDVSVRLMGTD